MKAIAVAIADCAALPGRAVPIGRSKGHQTGMDVGLSASPLLTNKGEPRLSVVVLSYNALYWTKRCLDNLVRHTDVPFEAIVVDNGSEGDVVAYLRQLAEATGTTLIQNESNRGYSAGNNQGFAASTAPTSSF